MKTPGVAAYYDRLLATLEKTTLSSASVQFGYESVSIQTSRPPRSDSFLQTMNHLVAEENAAPDSRLLVVFREDADVPLSPIPWQWHSPRVTEGAVTCQYFGSSHSILFWNDSTKVHVLVIAAVTDQLLTRPEYMRVVLQGFLAELLLDSVHGGTLGGAQTGVLITNRGGSGKSSLVAAGVLEGFQSLGDDFLLIDSNPTSPDRHELFSIFKTLKLSEKSPSWPAYSSQLLEKGEDKDLFFLDSIEPAAMTARQRITAIIVPTVGKEFSLTMLDAESVIAALAPNSLGMGMHPARTLQALRALTHDIPLYSMVVTPDLRPALSEITKLVHS